MGKKLVIVESPAKAKTINKILGDDFIVKASMGHVRDLPEKKLGVDIDKGFQCTYTTIKGKQKVISELKSAAKDVEAIYLAPDPDREGEAIAWHLMAALKDQVPEDQFYRVTYNEITAPAIREAFEHPTRIDQHRVDSQQARRVLDRIVGYKVSPLLWRRIRGGSSAGRVQSVALRLVCEREKEILAFVKEKYWVLGAKLRKLVDPCDLFLTRLVKIDGEKAEIKQEEKALRIVDALKQRAFKVVGIKRREITKRARPPYITSTLQQAGSGALGYSPSRTMSIAQKLYEGVDFGEGPAGLITYMRTDSVTVSKQALGMVRGFIGEKFGSEYVPEKPNFYKSRSSAQEAHEAIRPTDVNRTPESLEKVLEPEQLKLYRLIWSRFVASQMSPAKIAQRSVDIEAPPQDGEENREMYLFRASASDVLFPGYMKVTGVEKSKKSGNGNGDDEDEDIEGLPELEEGENVECVEPLSDAKETQPPPRYTEASLVRALEENGVGRPSTYAATISTIKARKYVEREKKALRPTSVGMNVNDFLVTHLDALFNVKFTADMEESLDEVEEGKVEWTGMLGEFYKKFVGWVDNARGPAADPSMVKRVIEALEQVSEWAEPEKRGKRTYSDEKFVKSVKKQLDDDKKISQRQAEALVKIAVRYKDQMPDWDQVVAELDLAEKMGAALRPPEPPREETLEKLDALKGVKFDEPRTVGKKTYDDRVFCESLAQQVKNGKRLSFRQVKYLDRLLTKYAEQIGGMDEISKRFDFAPAVVVEDPDLEELLQLMEQVTEWKPPAQRGKRMWDDKKFFDSLKRQYDQKKSLSPKQSASLRKMVQRYANQIPNYDEVADRLELKPRKK